MKKVGIICALKEEMAPFLNIIKKQSVIKKAGLDFAEGEMDGVAVVAVVCGIGKVNAAIAAQAMIEHFEPSCVIMSGTAGGIDNALKICDVVICTAALYHDADADFLANSHPFVPNSIFHMDKDLVDTAKRSVQRLGQKVCFGLTVSGDKFIDINGRGDIVAAFNPLCVDCETAAAAHACHIYEVPFVAVRAVSDTEELHGVEVFRQYLDKAAKSAFEVARGIIEEAGK